MKSRRTYHSPQREQQANATRGAILQAAAELLADSGYVATSMQAIATGAGVSLATVYLYFATKPAIVAALAEQIAASPDLSVERVEAVTDPVAQLGLGAKILRNFNERSWLVADLLREARGLDPELTAIRADWQRRHLDAMKRAVAALGAAGALKPGLTPAKATDTLFALAGTDVYRLLVLEREWTPQEYEEWLFETACRELLDMPPDEKQ